MEVATVAGDLAVGVLANLLTVAIVIALRLLSRLLNRQQLQFFGVHKTRRFNVYYGCIPIGANLVGAAESQEAIRFAELFQYRIPNVEADSLVSRIFLAGVKVVGIAACPGTPVCLEDSFLTLGSPAYTFASAVFEKELEPNAYVRDGSIHFPSGDVTNDPTQAVLVKKCRNSLAYFYAAGLNEPATLAASRYLTEHWDELDRKYPRRESFFARVQFNPDHQEVALLAEGPLASL